MIIEDEFEDFKKKCVKPGIAEHIENHLFMAFVSGFAAMYEIGSRVADNKINADILAKELLYYADKFQDIVKH